MTDPNLPVIVLLDEVHQGFSDTEAITAQMRELARLSRIGDIDIRPEMPLKQYATLAEFEENA